MFCITKYSLSSYCIFTFQCIIHYTCSQLYFVCFLVDVARRYRRRDIVFSRDFVAERREALFSRWFVGLKRFECGFLCFFHFSNLSPKTKPISLAWLLLLLSRVINQEQPTKSTNLFSIIEGTHKHNFLGNWHSWAKTATNCMD